MTHNPSQPISHPVDNPIEPWQLTAHALGELDAADAMRVEQALESDPSLRIELEQIQQTLASVRSALASSSANLKLDEKRTASIASHIEQLVAPNAIIAPNETVTVSTLKLVERPFYRRKRFAALLATAASIPIVATWGPALFDKWFQNGSTVAYQMNDNAGYTPAEPKSSVANSTTSIDDLHARSAPASFANRVNPAGSTELAIKETHESTVTLDMATIFAPSDAVAADSGLIGDVDLSFVPEMGLTIVKGNKKDVERVQGVIDGIKAGAPSSQPSSGTVASTDGESAQSKNDAIAQVLVDQYNDLTRAGRYDEAEEVSKKVRDITPETEIGEVLYNKAKIQRSAEEQLTQKQSKEEKWVDHFNSLGKSSAPDDGMRGLGRNEGSRELEKPASAKQASAKQAGAKQAGGLGGGGYGGAMGGEGGMPEGYPGGSGGSGRVGPVGPPRIPRVAGADVRLLAESKSVSDNRPYRLEHLSDLPEELRANVQRFRSIPPDNIGTDRFEKIVETPFFETQKAPLSTFSIDVDTASYSKIRQTLIEGNRLPSPNMVRIEEMVNYFQYEYAGPQDGRPFASHMIVDRCPWNSEHQLVRIGLQAKKIEPQARVKANIVFLLDVSGSMNEPNKLPLVKKSLAMMVNQLTENDRVAIVVYAGAAGCVLPSTCGIEKQRILSALDHLNAGGSTNGGQGIQLAYSIAKEHFVPGGANRVVLCTDGDFNVGVTGDDALVAMMQENAKSNIFLTCLGFGAGNYNDTMMEKISNKGNGVYGMIDNELEGRRMMVEQLGGTLVTVAKDVKIQVDFNSAKIAGYRLIGYEDRRLANKDFSDDKKDAGEIGAGHRVTALYEVIPAGKWLGVKNPSEGEVSKYAKKPEPKFEVPVVGENSSELLTLRVRYKEPEGSESTLQEFVLKETDGSDRPQVDRDMRWATAVAEFGLLLRRSEMAPNANWSDMLERATNSAGGDPYRLECLTMMRKAMGMK